jgi:hypothetical protein
MLTNPRTSDQKFQDEWEMLPESVVRIRVVDIQWGILQIEHDRGLQMHGPLHHVAYKPRYLQVVQITDVVRFRILRLRSQDATQTQLVQLHC